MACKTIDSLSADSWIRGPDDRQCRHVAVVDLQIA